MMHYVSQICEKMQKESGWTIVRDPVYMVPYAYRGYQWIGYDDEQSIALKVHYLQQKGLGGGMVWSIDTDDFNGICGDPYILTRTMYTMLVGEVVIPTPDPDATTEVCNTKFFFFHSAAKLSSQLIADFFCCRFSRRCLHRRATFAKSQATSAIRKTVRYFTFAA